MEKNKSRKLSSGKRIGGFLLLAVAVFVGFVVGWGVINLFLDSPSKHLPIPDEFLRIFPPPPPVSPILGPVSLMLGIVSYLVILFTNCFTFDFSKPFWKAFKRKFFFIHIVVLFFVSLGIGFSLSIVVTPMLVRSGFSWVASFVIPNLAVAVIVLFFATLIIHIWAPLERSLIKKRLLALGVSKEDIDKGILVGISDPARSSLKKFSFIEEDVGMLWFETDKIIYKGDSDHFEYRREQLLAIERVVDSWSIDALVGAVHIILEFKEEDGRERRVRLHSEGNWILKQVARSLDRLAARLEDWLAPGKGY